jgi:hypothetical protein
MSFIRLFSFVLLWMSVFLLRSNFIRRNIGLRNIECIAFIFLRQEHLKIWNKLFYIRKRACVLFSIWRNDHVSNKISLITIVGPIE